MRENFDRFLSALHSKLFEMATMAEQIIAMSVKSLEQQDMILAHDTMEFDQKINDAEREIERECLKCLLRYQPVVAEDLRRVSSALKMITDMERIGDQASDIAEIAGFVTKSGIGSKVHIADMARATIKMVTESIESFVKKDVSAAESVIKHDDVVDGLFEEVKNELISAVKDETDNAEALIDLLMIAKYFERIGDHAENIAEWVIYSITGEHAEIDG